MKQRQFAFTAIRVLAVYFLVAGIGKATGCSGSHYGKWQRC